MRVRELQPVDVYQIKSAYKAAFAGFPWRENLSEEEVNRRWESQSSQPGFECLVIEVGDEIAGAIWWDWPSIEDFAAERGEAIATFARSYLQEGYNLVWEREVIVDPGYQGKKVGNLLRSAFIASLALEDDKIIILTRMRDDNTPILHIAERFGFRRSGVRTKSSQVQGLFHEYWFKLMSG